MGNQFGWNNPNITNSQDKGFGLRGSVKFLKRGSLVDFYVEPYIRFLEYRAVRCSDSLC